MKNLSFEYQKADWKQVSPVCATVSHTFSLQEPVKGQKSTNKTVLKNPVLCLSAHSPYTLKYFPRFPDYAERMKNTQKEISYFNNAWRL